MSFRKFISTTFVLLLTLRVALPDEGIQMWIQILREARSPGISISKKQETLSLAMEEYKSRLKKKFGHSDEKLRTLLTVDTEEAKQFRNSLLKCDNPADISTCEMRDFYSEINYLISGVIAGGEFDRCKDQFDPQWLKQQALSQSVLQNQSSYCASCEGAGGYRQYQLVHEKKNDEGKSYFNAWPALYSGNTVASLFNASEPILRESYLNAPASYFGKKFPARPEKMSQDKYAEMKMKEEMKENLYERTILNAVKTKLAFQYLFGKKTYTQISKEIDSEISSQCKHCSATAKESLKKRTLWFLHNKVPKEKAHKLSDTRNTVIRLCKSLNKEGYFSQSYAPELARMPDEIEPGEVVVTARRKSTKTLKEILVSPSPAPTPTIDPLAPTPDPKNIDFSKFKYVPPTPRFGEPDHYGMMMRNLQDTMARKKALSRLVTGGEEGLLLLTDALTKKKDDGVPYRVNLNCSWDSDAMDKDIETIENGIKQATENIQKHIDEVNETVKPMTGLTGDQLSKTNKQIRFMVSKNPTAAGEALADNPFSTKIVCEAIEDEILGELRANDLKLAKTMGLGVLSLATFGIASVPLAIIGGLTISGLATWDQIEQKNAAENRAESFTAALYAGQAGDPFVYGKIKENEAEASALSFEWYDVLGFGLDSIDGMHLFSSLIKTVNNTRSIRLLTKLAKERYGAETLRTMTKEDRLNAMLKLADESKSGKVALNKVDVDPPKTRRSVIETELEKEKTLVKSTSKTPLAIDNETPLFNSNQYETFVKSSADEKQKRLKDIGIETKRTKVSDYNAAGERVEVDAFEIDLNQSNSTSHLVNYFKRIQKVAGKRKADAALSVTEESQELRVIIRPEDDPFVSPGFYDPEDNILFVSRRGFEKYLKTGNVDYVTSHELGHYLLTMDPKAAQFYKIELTGSRVNRYEDFYSAEELSQQSKDIRKMGAEAVESFQKKISDLKPPSNTYEITSSIAHYKSTFKSFNEKLDRLIVIADESAQMARIASSSDFLKQIDAKSVSGKSINVRFTLKAPDGKPYEVSSKINCSSCQKLKEPGVDLDAVKKEIQNEISSQLSAMNNLAQTNVRRSKFLKESSEDVVNTLEKSLSAGKIEPSDIKKIQYRLSKIKSNSADLTNEFNKKTSITSDKSLDGSLLALKPSVDQINKHVLKPEMATKEFFENSNTVTKPVLSGGMHTSKAFDEFLVKRPDLKDTLRVEELDNGVVRVTLPNEGATLKSSNREFVKHLFPKDWDDERIRKAILNVTKNNKPVKKFIVKSKVNDKPLYHEDFEAVVDGVTIRVSTQNKKITSAYPSENQPGVIQPSNKSTKLEKPTSSKEAFVSKIEKIEYVTSPDYSPNLKFINKDSKSIESMMKMSPIKRVFKTQTSGIASDNLFVEYSNGAIAILKSDAYQTTLRGQLYTSSKNDVVSDITDEIFNFDIVPPTAYRTIEVDGKKYSGSLMFIVPNANDLIDLPINSMPFSEQVKFDFFDLLTSQRDRNANNIIMSKASGEPKYYAIDNGLSFEKGDRDYDFEYRRPREGRTRRGSRTHSVEEQNVNMSKSERSNRALAPENQDKLKTFLKSEEGQTLISNIKRPTKADIEAKIKSRFPELTERELKAYVLRLEMNQKRLIEYIESKTK